MSSSPPAEAFNIVLLYERSDLLSKALATCSLLRRELGDAFALDFHLWRIDLAASAEAAGEADRDIAAADVIVLGVGGNDPFPSWFRSWKKGTVGGRGGPQGAIVAIVDSDHGPGAAGETWNSVLRGGATQIHPEIFVWESPAEFGAAGLQPPADELEPAAVGAMAGV
jgi:hypothetical protein